MDPIIDTDLLVARKKRAAKGGVGGADFLMRRAATDLGERLSAVERAFGEAAALFCFTGDAKAAVLASGKAASVARVEADAAFLGDAEGCVAEPETVPLSPNSVGLVVSLLSLQDTNDTPGMLVQIRRALRPDGLFLGVPCKLGAGGLERVIEVELTDAEHAELRRSAQAVTETMALLG